MKRERPAHWRGNLGDQPTLVTTAPLVTARPARAMPPRSRVATALARLPAPMRTLATAVFLLGAAELGVIARYGDGSPAETPTAAVAVAAPLYAAGAALLVRLFGRFIHRGGRVLGGTGDRRTAVGIVSLLAAFIVLAGVSSVLIWEPGSTGAGIVQLILAVIGLILGVRVIAYVENVGQVRATIAVLLPVLILVLVVIGLMALHSAVLPLLPADWRVR